jgi:Flp pilus assembly pilin Flp
MGKWYKRGQTMVEYALIIAAVGLIAFGSYRALGNGISTITSGIDSVLTTA